MQTVTEEDELNKGEDDSYEMPNSDDRITWCDLINAIKYKVGFFIMAGVIFAGLVAFYYLGIPSSCQQCEDYYDKRSIADSIDEFENDLEVSDESLTSPNNLVKRLIRETHDG